MLKAIKHGLGNLVNFAGRDARQAFWYYVLFIYVITIVVSMVVVIPMMIQGIFTGIQAGINAGQSNDPVAAKAAAEAAVLGSMDSMVSNTMWMTIGTGVLMLVALAAAFVRRLHDSDLSGLWALIPGAIQIVNLVLAPAMMRGMMDNITQAPLGDPMAPMRAMQGSFGLATVVGWAAIILVIVLGVRKSTPGPNRYGAEPFTA